MIKNDELTAKGSVEQARAKQRNEATRLESVAEAETAEAEAQRAEADRIRRQADNLAGDADVPETR